MEGNVICVSSNEIKGARDLNNGKQTRTDNHCDDDSCVGKPLENNNGSMIREHSLFVEERGGIFREIIVLPLPPPVRQGLILPPPLLSDMSISKHCN